MHFFVINSCCNYSYCFLNWEQLRCISNCVLWFLHSGANPDRKQSSNNTSTKNLTDPSWYLIHFFVGGIMTSVLMLVVIQQWLFYFCFNFNLNHFSIRLRLMIIIRLVGAPLPFSSLSHILSHFIPNDQRSNSQWVPCMCARSVP